VPWETSLLVRRLRPQSCLQTWWAHKMVDPPAECNLYEKDKFKFFRARLISPSSEEILARGGKQIVQERRFQVPTAWGSAWIRSVLALIKSRIQNQRELKIHTSVSANCFETRRGNTSKSIWSVATFRISHCCAGRVAVCYSLARKEHGNLKEKVREGVWQMSHKLWRGRWTERVYKSRERQCNSCTWAGLILCHL
jgi:hypothetical protein